MLTRFLLPLVLMLVGLPAHALDFSSCRSVASDGTLCPDQGTAASALATYFEQWKRDNSPNDLSRFQACPYQTVPLNDGSNLLMVYMRVRDTALPSANCSDGTFFNKKFPDGKTCATRPAMHAGFLPSSGPQCYQGCEYNFAATKNFRVDTQSGNSINFGRGNWEPNGTVCSSDAAAPPPKDNYCAMLDGGYKMCRDSQDRNCVVSGKTGRQYCGPSNSEWKASNPDRTESVSQSPPSGPPGLPPTPASPRPGEQWTQGPSASITNVTNNVTSNISTSNQSGTPNTNPGSGVDGDGSDNPGTGEGEEDGDEGSVSGGTNCAAPPACSGNALACYAIEHNWRTSCDGVGSKVPLVAEFDQAVNDATEDDAADLGAVLGNDGKGDLHMFREVKKFNPADLDDSGFLGQGQCPTFPAMEAGGHSFPIDLGPICELLANVSNFVVALAYMLGFRLIAGGGRK